MSALLIFLLREDFTVISPLELRAAAGFYCIPADPLRVGCAMSKAKRVFVVDDEYVICWTLGLIVESMGFATQTFTNPCEALTAALEECPDLLISDVTMPQMSGIDLAIEVRQNHPKCKVLLVSGLAAVDDLLLKARENGFEFPILRKPVPPATLMATVKGCLNGNGHLPAHGAD